MKSTTYENMNTKETSSNPVLQKYKINHKNDIFSNLAKRNTPLRNSIYSNDKVLVHVDKLKRLQNMQPISPTSVLVDLEAFCNDNCGFCTTRKENGYNNSMLKLLNVSERKKNFLDDFKPIGRSSEKSRLSLDMAYRLPEMLKDAKIHAIELTGGGEPTLWPAFDILLENLVKNDIEIGLVTNGSNISDKRAKLIAQYCTWVRFSMDSSNEALHKKMHRTSNNDFKRRIKSIEQIIKYNRNGLIIGVSFVITPQNVLDIEKSCMFYRDLGVDHLRFTWMYDKTGTAGLTAEEIQSIKDLLIKCKKKHDDDSFGILYDDNRIDFYSQPNDDFSKCHMQRFIWAIGADANVYPCCIMKYNEKFSIGNIQDQTLEEIIYDKYSKNKMDTLNPQNCFPCWLRNKNKTITKALEKPIKELNDDLLPTHHNFV
ncbi:radical SAM protein [Nitrosopumilus sp.]|uniref:radical SAM protein n=1 Tax=Nitrosopumilus sp. TaxID=2024843 RepID=UPI003B5C4A2C